MRVHIGRLIHESSFDNGRRMLLIKTRHDRGTWSQGRAAPRAHHRDAHQSRDVRGRVWRRRRRAFLCLDGGFGRHVRRRGGLCAQSLCIRSEEHTSELQSLMRLSYAVFCLKKKHPRPSPLIITTTVLSHYTNTPTP